MDPISDFPTERGWEAEACGLGVRGQLVLSSAWEMEGYCATPGFLLSVLLALNKFTYRMCLSFEG